MPYSNDTHLVARNVLAATAWITLGLIILGIVISIPSIERVVAGPDASIFWRRIELAVMVFAAFAVVFLWVAAVWHASTLGRNSVPIPKPLLIATLVIGSFLAGLFYYFLYVLWISENKAESQYTA